MNYEIDSIGKRIRNARKLMNYTQSELGEKSGMSLAYIHQLETGKIKYPRVDACLRIVEALNEDPLWIFFGIVEPKCLVFDSYRDENGILRVERTK